MAKRPKKIDPFDAMFKKDFFSTPPGPLPWEFKCKDGTVFNPQTTQKWLVDEIQHGASTHAMIRFFSIGDEALDIFLDCAVSIPKSVGEKVTWLHDNNYRIRRKTAQDTRNEYVARKIYLEKLFSENERIREEYKPDPNPQIDERKLSSILHRLKQQSAEWRHDAKKATS